MSDNKPTIAPNSGSGESLKIFQLTTDGIKDKSSKDYGLAIMRYISSTTSFNTGGYYFTRNARFIKNRNYANGVMDIEAMFRDRFQLNSKPNYIALNFNALQIVNRIISGLVGRWMKRSPFGIIAKWGARSGSRAERWNARFLTRVTSLDR